ncbi:MAG: hypothetical protein V1797_04285 [Pseudomonadota bacterium]
MPLFGIRIRYLLVSALALVLLVAAVWWLGGAGEQAAQDDRRPAPLRPATINNVVLRIQSNVMRIQSAMVEVGYSEYRKALNDQIKTVDSMDAAVRQDFAAMGAHFADNNPEFAKASRLFAEWKAIRDEAIGLAAAGEHLRAQSVVQEKSEAQVWKIRSALDALSRFAQGRVDGFDSKEAARHRPGLR